MPRINTRITTRRLRLSQIPLKYLIIAAAALAALIVALVLIIALPSGNGPDAPEPAETAAPVRTGIAQNADSIRVNYRPAPQPGGYLPLFRKADTMEKILCITVVGCTDGTNLSAILDVAQAQELPLTLFPMAKAAQDKTFVAENLRRAVSLGCQIENGTYNAGEIYAMTDADMAKEITDAQAVLCRSIGKSVDMRFLCTKEGTDRYDLRTHLYLNKLGYCGMVYRSVNLSSESIDTLEAGLAAGNIYELRCNNSDADLLARFAVLAKSRGYTFVTLNDMFGYAPQQTRDLSATDDLVFPEPDPYSPACNTPFSTGWYSYDIYLMQKALSEKGFLEHEPTGYYGAKTAQAVSDFQTANGLEATGKATPEVQRMIFGLETAKNEPAPETEPAPESGDGA